MAGPTQTKLFTGTYIKENTGTININNGRGRPVSNNSKDDELKARVDPDDKVAVLAFCAGRKITRSDFIRQLITLDVDYYDIIPLLNDPEIKKLFFHILTVTKKI